MNGGEKREVETERGKSINVSEAKGKERNPRPITQILLPTTHDPARPLSLDPPTPFIPAVLFFYPLSFVREVERSGPRKGKMPQENADQAAKGWMKKKSSPAKHELVFDKYNQTWGSPPSSYAFW